MHQAFGPGRSLVVDLTSTMGNTTLDVTHNDQLTVVIRYVNKEGVPSERLIKTVLVSGDEKARIDLAHVLIIFSSYDHIRRKLRIWFYLLKKSSMKSFIFCTVTVKKCNVDLNIIHF